MLALVAARAVGIQHASASLGPTVPPDQSIAGLLHHGVFRCMNSVHTRLVSGGMGVVVVYVVPL